METAQRRTAITKLSRIPGYAGGGEVSPWSLKGIVNTVKGALRKTPEQIKRDAEMAEYRKNAEAERAAAKAPPAKTETPAISAYAGNTALEKRMAEAERKAGGGAIRGKGTGTSDEIPAMLSNGEYVIKAASADIAGKPLLDAINALADTKGKGAKKGALREMATGVVHMFGGGSAEDEKNRIDALASQQKTAFAQQQANSNELVASGQRAVDAREAVLNITSPSVPKPAEAPAVSQSYPDESQRAPAVNAPATAPAPTSVSAPTLNGAEGKDVGFGATRYDVQGKSPLFTNLAANDPSNVALMNRKPMTAQDQGAMDGIQARQDASDQGMRNKMQYDAEVAQAQAFNAGQKQFHMEQAALKGNKGAQAILAGNLQADTTRRGQDITAKGQDLQAGALRESQKLAQNKDGRESAASAMDQKSRQQLMDAQQEFLNAKTPDEQKAAERKLITLGGKQQSKDEYAYAPGGQAVVDGQLVTQPGVVFNKRTGQPPAQQGEAGVPDAATARTQALAALKANPANKDVINKRLAAAGYQPI